MEGGGDPLNRGRALELVKRQAQTIKELDATLPEFEAKPEGDKTIEELVRRLEQFSDDRRDNTNEKGHAAAGK